MCVVPLGMTAMERFFAAPPPPGPPELGDVSGLLPQPDWSKRPAANSEKSEMVFFITFAVFYKVWPARASDSGLDVCSGWSPRFSVCLKKAKAWTPASAGNQNHVRVLSRVARANQADGREHALLELHVRLERDRHASQRLGESGAGGRVVLPAEFARHVSLRDV